MTERPRDMIDSADNQNTQKNGTVGVSPVCFLAFLALNEVEMEILVRAALNAQAEEARRVTRAESLVAEASTRLTQLVIQTLTSIAVGLARFNHFAQLELLQRGGPEPKPEVNAAVTEKIAKARPIIAWAVRDFIQAQIDDAKPMSPCRRRASPLRDPNRTG